MTARKINVATSITINAYFKCFYGLKMKKIGPQKIIFSTNFHYHKVIALQYYNKVLITVEMFKQAL